MRRPHLHVYVPDALLPAFVFLIGRRQCCGTRRFADHLRRCPLTPPRSW